MGCKTTYYITVIFVLSNCCQLFAQQNEVREQQKVNSLSRKFETSYSKNNDTSTAKNYEELAQLFAEKSEYKKAEEYLKKALTIYTKLNSKNDKVRVGRNLAKTQEQLGKSEEAIKNYELSKKESNDKDQIIINENDINRLQNANNPRAQSSYTQGNIDIYKRQGNREELANAYKQQAENSIQQQNTDEAIQNYNQAIDNTISNSIEQVKIKDDLATLYLNTNQTDKAKEIKNEIISNSIQANNSALEIQTKQSLANIYLQENNEKQAVRLLQESYNKALTSSNTIEAKKSLELLINYYREKGNYEKSIQLYDQFMKTLEKLVKSDSSLMDTQLLEATESKIKQLEKEKGLQEQLIDNKNQLIDKQNTFNYFLIGGIILIIIFLVFMIKAFFSVKNKNKKIALQSLRREMNPHFIFNSLNSVNQFIAENKELEANKYLSSYSNLMRNVMENSNKDFISLSNEIELVKKYLDLEHLRFKEKFDYKISVDEKLDPDTTLIPNMIIQPQLENAVWHGLRYKNEKGLLQITFFLNNNNVIIEIEDDGIGLTKSQELKTMNQKSHESRGLNNTKERIHLLNELYQKNIELSITEKTEEGMQGTVVEIRFPLISKI